MADRTSAALLSEVFSLLAENPSDDHRALALRVWGMTRGRDFHPGQMECDGALFALGLARTVPDPDDPGETMVERGPAYTEETDQ